MAFHLSSATKDEALTILTQPLLFYLSSQVVRQIILLSFVQHVHSVL